MPSGRYTLRQKLTVSLMSVGLASLIVAGVWYIAFDLVSYRYWLRGRMELVAERVAWRWQMLAGNPEADRTWSQGLAEDSSVRSAHLIDIQGKPLAAHPHASTPLPQPHKEELFSADFFAPAVRRDVFRSGRPLGAVIVQADSSALLARLRNHAGIFLALVGISSLITLVLSRKIHHRFSDQLLDLAHAANAISSRKDYSIRAVRRSDDEIGILVDTFNHMITQVQMRDQQLKAEVKRAEAARIAKSQFLATMSHEIRTPINGIIGMTELLLDTQISGEQEDFAQTIHKSAEGLLSIINDILDFSKGEAGRYEIEQIPFSLSKVVSECLDTVSIVAAEKQLELCCELDERSPPQLRGDPSRLRQVLLNLLSNALKFTPSGEIVLRVLLEDRQRDQARIRFEVQDTGIGIPEDRIDRLFKSFSQVDASKSRKYGGTGLGLAISKQIVEAMGGTMFVKTEVGVGSTFGFKVQLPIETAADGSEEDVLAPPSGLHVLLADPNATSSAAIARMLREENTLEITADASAARAKLIESYGAKPFDLVLIDLRLAEALDVPEAKRPKKATPVPIIVLAAVNQLGAAAAVKWAGSRSALAKPVKPRDLYWCIAETLRGPLPSEASAHDSPKRKQEPLLNQARILVAEDHPVNQRITTRFLDKLGVQWQLVENGEEALRAVATTEFDLVLMDVQMPVMDGLEATLAIRKWETLRGTHVPIIALTANVLEEHRKEAQQAGFDDYLAKPIKLEELRAHILKWIPDHAAVEA